MSLWPFKRKPKPPPFDIFKGFYMVVLAPDGPLPPLLSLINPQGSNSAVKGYGAPITQGASKDVLNEALKVGTYACATSDKMTLVLIDVFRASEVAAFQVPTDSALLERAELTGERLTVARAAAWYLNLHFRSYSPNVYESVQFILDLVTRLAAQSGGVIADPVAEMFRLPGELRVQPRLSQLIDFREVGSVKALRLSDGVWVSTRGLRKFLIPEYEMYGLPTELADVGVRMVLAAAQQALIGQRIQPGETAFAESSPLEAVAGTREREEWGDRPTIEFRDPGGDSAATGVAAWKSQGN